MINTKADSPGGVAHTLFGRVGHHFLVMGIGFIAYGVMVFLRHRALFKS